MTTTAATTGSQSAAAAQATGSSASQQLAGNFDDFLQLLTTQLQNQDPLDPLDTNSFTQELVEFTSVEQQIDMNTNMQTLIALQQSTAATSALQLVGQTVTVNGNTAGLSNATSSPATWSLNASGPGTANITITSSTGQTAYTGTLAVNAGTQSYSWNGQGSNGVTWPDGSYTISVTATGANGQPVSVSTQIQGVVSSVNMSTIPPTVTVSGQTVPITSIVSVGNMISGPPSGVSNLGSLNTSTLNTSINNLKSSLGKLLQSL